MRKILMAVALVFALVLFTHASAGTATAAGPAYHVVQPGQTMSSIAALYRVSTWALAYANGIWNPNLLYVGQLLLIPYPGYVYYPRYYYPYPVVYYPRPVYGCYYWVKYGDTLSGIAWRFGTDPWRLARANGIYNLNWIYAGQRLFIPGCN